MAQDTSLALSSTTALVLSAQLSLPFWSCCELSLQLFSRKTTSLLLAVYDSSCWLQGPVLRGFTGTFIIHCFSCTYLQILPASRWWSSPGSPTCHCKALYVSHLSRGSPHPLSVTSGCYPLFPAIWSLHPIWKPYLLSPDLLQQSLAWGQVVACLSPLFYPL
jgi:hypothetical protein